MNPVIIGQPVIEDWFFGMQVKCPCGDRMQLVGLPGVTRQCKACGRVFRLGGVPTFVQQGSEVLIDVPLLMSAPMKETM